MKDWNGNSMALFATNGDTSHSNEERESHDYYATPPEAVRMLLTGCEEHPLHGDDDTGKDNGYDSSSYNTILEPCCGAGHIVKELLRYGYQVEANDLYDHGFPCEHKDFLTEYSYWPGDIITNPPYRQAAEFVEHAMDIVDDGCKVIMFLKLSFLEGKERRKLFAKYPPKRIWVSSSRLNCGKNGIFKGTSAVCYCWFVWEKGYDGPPTIHWFN